MHPSDEIWLVGQRALRVFLNAQARLVRECASMPLSFRSEIVFQHGFYQVDGDTARVNRLRRAVQEARRKLVHFLLFTRESLELGENIYFVDDADELRVRRADLLPIGDDELLVCSPERMAAP